MIINKSDQEKRVLSYSISFTCVSCWLYRRKNRGRGKEEGERKKVVMSAENKTKKKAKVKLLFLGTYQKLLKGY